MSFSSRIKEELSRHMSAARHCQIAEIAAILSLCGRIQISGDDHYSIKIHTENVTVARKCFTLLRKTFNIETDISIRRNAHLGKNRIYSVCVKQHEDALRVLKATKLLSEDGEIGENLSVVGNVVVQNPCCRRAFLRGAFSHQDRSVIRRSFTILRSSARQSPKRARSSPLWRRLISMQKLSSANATMWYILKREARS